MKQDQFEWIPFFEAIADGLLRHKDDRTALVDAFHKIANARKYQGEKGSKYVYCDRDGYGAIGKPLKDIAPFTAIGLYLRVRHEKQTYAAEELSKFLKVNADVPNCYWGVPSVRPNQSWFFASQKGRKDDDFNILWTLLEKAINFSKNEKSNTAKHEFVEAFDCALKVNQIARSSITRCLFFIRPKFFPTLDGNSFEYIPQKFGIPIKEKITGKEYLEIRDLLQKSQKKLSPLFFPKISYCAYDSQQSKK